MAPGQGEFKLAPLFNKQFKEIGGHIKGFVSVSWACSCPHVTECATGKVKLHIAGKCTAGRDQCLHQNYKRLLNTIVFMYVITDSY